MMARAARIAVLSALALLSAGVVGPHYAPPPTPPAARGPLSAAASPAFSATPPPDAWWRLYDDPAIDALVEKALIANTDLRIATANLQRARALLAEARTAQLPSTTVNAGAGYGRTAAQGAQPAFNSEFYSAGFDVSYEIDLFGRVSSSVAAARADADAAAATRDGVRISVAAETTRAYADACSAAAQLAVANQTLELQTQTFDITERQASAGRGSPVDVQRARAQLESVRATVPFYIASRRNALSRLAVLTGDPPEIVSPAAAACTTAPLLAKPLPVGDGGAMLKRRPDVRQADREFAAATSRVGVATAALYPSITLGGGINTLGSSVDALGRSGSVSFSVGPLITWSFPNIAVARAQIAQANAVSDAALARFDGTVLNALQETEIALTNYANELDRNASLRRARDHNAEAVRIIRLRYTYGAENFLDVLDAQRALAETEASTAASTATLTSNQITVFKALGGGWQHMPPGSTNTAATTR